MQLELQQSWPPLAQGQSVDSTAEMFSEPSEDATRGPLDRDAHDAGTAPQLITSPCLVLPSEGV